MTDRITNLISIGRLARENAGDDEIAGLWRNALQALADAGLSNLSGSGRLVRGYDAGRIAAHAVVRAHDPRVRARNHHEVTLAVAGLVGSAELQSSLREFEAFRGVRMDVEYGWQERVSRDDIDRLLTVLRSIFDHSASHLREQRPAIEKQIRPPG